MTAQLLQQAMKKVLADMENHKKNPPLRHGKQTLRQLMKHNTGVSNIEITDQNIRAFSSTAKKDKLKKYLLPNLPYLFFVYLFDKLCQAVRLAPGLDVSEKLLHIGQGFQTAFASSAPSLHVLDICVGILGAVLVRLAVYVKSKNAKKYRKGIEYGSARWSA